MRRAALALLALALVGCQTTQEESARLEHVAKERERTAGPATGSLAFARRDSRVQVTAAALLRDSEGAAAAVSLRNTSSETLRDVPIEIRMRDARGAQLYANDIPGLGAPLRSLALLPAHARLTWVDDQIPSAARPASVEAIVGQAPVASAPAPLLRITAVRATEDPGSGPGAAGAVVNRSHLAQRELVVYAVARKGARIVAAGRAVIPAVPAGATVPFQLFFVGEPHGAQLQLSAPATTLG